MATPIEGEHPRVATPDDNSDTADTKIQTGLDDVRAPGLVPYTEHCLTPSNHIHDYTEPSISEQFGRRHGQNWPSPTLGATGKRRSSFSSTRSEPRSREELLRRTSGILYKVIPPKAVMGFDVFRVSRKSEEDIKAIKNKKNEILDSFEEVEAVLKEHREEEAAAMISAAKKTGIQNPSNYGSTSETSTPSIITTSPLTQAVGENGNTEQNLEEDLEEGAPLLAYKRRARTSPNHSMDINWYRNIMKVIFSNSLAVLASMLDSLMDLLSGAIIWYSARLRSNTTDGHRYPVGKARMEPLGIIVFASVMVTSFIQVMLQSIERLLEKSGEPVDLGFIILILLGLNILVKLALWAWCRTMKDSPSVLALAQDHLNDVVFNIFSIAFPIVGQYLKLWWLDAVGAIFLSFYIIVEWTGTCLHNIRRLTGQTATAADSQQLTYMAYRFSNVIQVIDTVRAYYVGDGLFVEVDIVLPPDTPLSQAHDLGESLQRALEKLHNVERAFVHIDYNAEHAIEHRK
ncbi:hypothetical protein BGX27_002483 [Mortierella sp. AM989]|nr:hypothetical protein BGX27_002483 [Mortierella sp. AM989]